MATKAFVLIEVAVGRTSDVVSALQAVRGVRSAEAVTGLYDVISIIEGADLTVVGDVVTARICTIDGVIRTVTCPAMELG